MDKENLLEKLKELVIDLDYNPYKLFFLDEKFKIYNDTKNKMIILKNYRNFNSMQKNGGDCIDLSYIALHRINKMYPAFRIQICAGSEPNYFTKGGHVCLRIKNSYFKSKNIIVDPVLKIVNYESRLKYKIDKIIADTKKQNGIYIQRNASIKYNQDTVIHFNNNKLLFLTFLPPRREDEKGFFALMNHKLDLCHLEYSYKLSNDKDFIKFCNKLLNTEIEEIPKGFEINKIGGKIWFK